MIGKLAFTEFQNSSFVAIKKRLTRNFIPYLIKRVWNKLYEFPIRIQSIERLPVHEIFFCQLNLQLVSIPLTFTKHSKT